MEAFVRTELARQRGEAVAPEVGDGPDIPGDAAGDERGEEEAAATHLGSGLTEIQLPLDVRLANIEATERARQELARSGGGGGLLPAAFGKGRGRGRGRGRG